MLFTQMTVGICCILPVLGGNWSSSMMWAVGIILIAQVVKRYERRRVVETERRIVDGTPARVETLRRRSQGEGVINTAYIERLNATFRERLAALTRRGCALARHTLTLQHGTDLIGTVYHFCTPAANLAYAGSRTIPAMDPG